MRSKQSPGQIISALLPDGLFEGSEASLAAPYFNVESFIGIDMNEACDCRSFVWNAPIEEFNLLVPDNRNYGDGRVKIGLMQGALLPRYILPTPIAEYRVVMQKMAKMVDPDGSLPLMNENDFIDWVMLEKRRKELLGVIDEQTANAILYGVPTSPKPQPRVKMDVVRKGKLHEGKA